MSDPYYEAAKTMLGSPRMWQWARPYFHDADPATDYPENVDTDGLKQLHNEPISGSERLMIQVAINLLGGNVEVDLDAIIAKFDRENFERFLTAIALLRAELQSGEPLVDAIVAFGAREYHIEL